MLLTMSSPNIYEVPKLDDIKEDVIEAHSEVVTEETSAPLTDRELLEAIKSQQEQLGMQLNWLCENLAGVFGLVQTMSQNGGGVRGLMKMMKEMNTNG